MKKQIGIWIDSTKAIIVALTGEQESIVKIESGIENRIYHDNEGDKGSFIGSRHINNEKKFEERRKQQIAHFLDRVIDRINHADEVCIFGPAEMKTKLSGRMDAVGKSIRYKLKSVATADTMTMNQVVAKVKEYYKSS